MTTPDWPEDSLPDYAYTALEELVHDQASELASNVVNAGSDDMRDYLLGNGWTLAEIAERIGLTADTEKEKDA